MWDDVATAAVEIFLLRWLYGPDSSVPRWLAILITIGLVALVAAGVWYFFLR